MRSRPLHHLLRSHVHLVHGDYEAVICAPRRFTFGRPRYHLRADAADWVELSRDDFVAYASRAADGGRWDLGEPEDDAP